MRSDATHRRFIRAGTYFLASSIVYLSPPQADLSSGLLARQLEVAVNYEFAGVARAGKGIPSAYQLIFNIFTGALKSAAFM